MIDPQNPRTSLHLHRVLYGDSDQMGIVYHPNYLKYLEIGRIELLRDCGYSYAKLEENGIRIPVLRVEIDYKRNSRFDDILEIRTTLESITRIRLAFSYQVFDAKSEALIVSARTEHAFTNAENKARRVEQDFVDALWNPKV